MHHEPAQDVWRVRLLGHVERIPLEAVELARVVELPRVRRQHEEVGLDVGTRDDFLREVLRRDLVQHAAGNSNRAPAVLSQEHAFKPFLLGRHNDCIQKAILLRRRHNRH